MSVLVQHVHHWEDTPLTITARAVAADQTVLVQAEVASIAVKVFDHTGAQISTTLVPVVADSIFDTLQTDYGWSADSTGYNFRYTVPAAYFPTGGTVERIEAIGTPTSGDPFPIGVWEVRVENLRSS